MDKDPIRIKRSKEPVRQVTSQLTRNRTGRRSHAGTLSGQNIQSYNGQRPLRQSEYNYRQSSEEQPYVLSTYQTSGRAENRTLQSRPIQGRSVQGTAGRSRNYQNRSAAARIANGNNTNDDKIVVKRKSGFNSGRLKLMGLGFGFMMVLCLAVLGIRAITGSSGTQTAKATAEDIQKGVSYLTQLENVDISTVQKDISDKEAMQKLEALKNGETDVWSQFSDSVIIGDSRAVGFSYYDFLPEERVLAEGGASLYQIPDWLDEIQALQPKYVFICLGINDIGLGAWDSDEYAVAYKEAMESIWEVCPNCVIFPNSTLLAIDPAFEQSTAWYDIPEYNDYLKAMCEENGYPFVDNTALCEASTDLYQPDGIHLMPDFYEPWALNMLQTVLEYEDSSSESAE